MNDDVIPPTITLKRILICMAVLGLVIVGLSKISDIRRDGVRLTCLSRFQNVNKVLTLYRADNDSFSPFEDISVSRKTHTSTSGQALRKYSDGKPLNCPFNDEQFGPNIRMGYGSKMTIPRPFLFAYGVQDTSVVSECLEHIQYRRRFELRDTNGINPFQESPVSGIYNVLLRNGTAKSVSFATNRQHWITHDGEFRRNEDRPNSWTGGYGHVLIFDFEPKPPQFER